AVVILSLLEAVPGGPVDVDVHQARTDQPAADIDHLASRRLVDERRDLPIADDHAGLHHAVIDAHPPSGQDQGALGTAAAQGWHLGIVPQWWAARTAGAPVSGPGVGRS